MIKHYYWAERAEHIGTLHCQIESECIAAEYILHCWGDSARLVSHLSRYRSGQARGSRAGGSLAKITKANKMFKTVLISIVDHDITKINQIYHHEQTLFKGIVHQQIGEQSL